MSRFEILSEISRLCGGWACSSFLMRLHNVVERAASTAQHKTLMKKKSCLYEEIDYACCYPIIQWSRGFSIISIELFWDKYVQLATSNNQHLSIESYICPSQILNPGLSFADCKLVSVHLKLPNFSWKMGNFEPPCSRTLQLEELEPTTSWSCGDFSTTVLPQLSQFNFEFTKRPTTICSLVLMVARFSSYHRVMSNSMTWISQNEQKVQSHVEAATESLQVREVVIEKNLGVRIPARGKKLEAHRLLTSKESWCNAKSLSAFVMCHYCFVWHFSFFIASILHFKVLFMIRISNTI